MRRVLDALLALIRCTHRALWLRSLEVGRARSVRLPVRWRVQRLLMWSTAARLRLNRPVIPRRPVPRQTLMRICEARVAAKDRGVHLRLCLLRPVWCIVMRRAIQASTLIHSCLLILVVLWLVSWLTHLISVDSIVQVLTHHFLAAQLHVSVHVLRVVCAHENLRLV